MKTTVVGAPMKIIHATILCDCSNGHGNHAGITCGASPKSQGQQEPGGQ